MADTTAIKNGVFMMFKDAVCVVTDFQHVNPGKGSAFVRVKLKNVQTGKTIDHTYKSGEAIDLVVPERATVQYLYSDPDNYYFMDNATYDQIGIPAEVMGESGLYLKEGQEVNVLSNEGRTLSVELPKKLTLEVTEAEPAVKGDTASGNVRKEVTLETGKKLQVPLFINVGDKVVVNTETGEYVERA